MTPTQTTVSLSLKEWDSTGNGGSSAITIEGMMDGTGISGISASNGDKLSTYYIGNYTTPIVGIYDYSAGAWQNTTPLYWDAISRTDFTGTFTALYTFGTTTTTPEADFLTGITTGVIFGNALPLSLEHAMSQISVTLVPGNGYTENPGNPTTEETNQMLTLLTTRVIYLQKTTTTTPAVHGDGTAYITLAPTVSPLIGGSGSGSADAPFENKKVYTVAPQTLTPNHTIVLKLSNGNAYSIKLTDIDKTGSSSGEKLFGTDDKIKAGKKYAITLTVNETDISLYGSIKDWENLTGSGDMKPEW